MAVPTLAPASRPTDGSILLDRSVEDLNKLAMQAKSARQRFEMSWYMNLAFYQGNQWVRWNNGRIEMPRLADHRILITDNRILGVVRTEIAKMTQQKPAWQVIPTTADDADLQASETGEKILDYLWRHLNMRDRLIDALLWSRITGAGFWKVCWDSTAGNGVTILVDADGSPALNAETGAPIRLQDAGSVPDGLGTKMVNTGDVHIEVVTPFEFYPDPLARELADCEWVIQESVKSPEYVYQHYGVRMAPDASVAQGLGDVQRPGTLQQSGGDSTYRGVKLREYWCKANSQHPQGMCAVWAKDKMLDQGPNVYGDLPFVMFQGVTVPGRFWPTSLVEQLRGPQVELNKLKSQIAENGTRIGNPAVLQSKQSDTQMTGVPGEIILYDDTTPNARPQYLQAPEMPAYVIQNQDRIIDSIEQISGQHEVSNAQVPAGVTAASAINLLLEADNTRLGPAIYGMEDNMALGGGMLLKMVGQYWTDERIIMIAGEDHAWDVLAFKGAALKENTHVEVQAGSMFPQSKAAKQAAISSILNLFIQNGTPLAGSDLKKLLVDYGAGSLERAFDDLSTDQIQVNRENQRMLNGDVLNVNSFDNHEVHIQIHTDLQKGPLYFQLPPPMQMVVEAHVMQHRMQFMASMVPQGAQFQPGANPQGAPPPGINPAPGQGPPAPSPEPEGA